MITMILTHFAAALAGLVFRELWHLITTKLL